jgi:hypothetical protein
MRSRVPLHRNRPVYVCLRRPIRVPGHALTFDHHTSAPLSASTKPASDGTLASYALGSSGGVRIAQGR